MKFLKGEGWTWYWPLEDYKKGVNIVSRNMSF